MAKLKAGFIGFMPWNIETEEYYKILETYAGLGYKGIEHGSAFLKGDVEANLARAKSFGMQPICAGLMVRPGETPDYPKFIEQAHQLGLTRAATYMSVAANYRFGMKPEPPTYDEVMAEIEQFEKQATLLKAEGIRFMFHNHDVELNMDINGKTPLELMVENTENLTFELDVGWVAYAGVDPVNLIYKMKDRIAALHIKDFALGTAKQNGQTMPRFTTPGTGMLNLKGVLEAGYQIGQEWAIVEQDFQYHLTQKETLTAAYLNMKETGYVE